MLCVCSIWFHICSIANICHYHYGGVVQAGQYHVFSIEVWQEGRAWQVRRRYREFMAFHQDLLEERLVKVQGGREEEEEEEGNSPLSPF
jgi:hypothetical protein